MPFARLRPVYERRLSRLEMFDLRYHVASLAAVFVALLIGILVGVAMRRANSTREQKAIREFVKDAYPSLIADRLRGKRIAILFVGAADAGIRGDIERAVRDASGGTPVRVRALKMPIDETSIAVQEQEAVPTRRLHAQVVGSSETQVLDRANEVRLRKTSCHHLRRSVRGGVVDHDGFVRQWLEAYEGRETLGQQLTGIEADDDHAH